MRAVRVRWVDAMSPAAGWHTQDALRALRPVKCVTYGLLLVDDPEFVTVMATSSEDGDGGSVEVIPRGMVLAIEDLP